MDILTTDDALIVETRYPAPVPTVWAALTDAQAFVSWWDKRLSLEPRLGGAFKEVWKNDDGRIVTTTGTVTDFAPPYHLALSWRDDDWAHDTTLKFALSPVGDDKTTLRLEHSGWSAFPEAIRHRLVESHLDGWTFHLRSLLGYLLREAGML